MALAPCQDRGHRVDRMQDDPSSGAHGREAELLSQLGWSRRLALRRWRWSYDLMLEIWGTGGVGVGRCRRKEPV